MMSARLLNLLLGAALLLQGCATYHRSGLPVERAGEIEQAIEKRRLALSGEMEERILALDPQHVTEREIKETLSHAPAPRIINIHGGIYPVHLHMISFSEFLVGMGYPRVSITNPSDGTYSFSCYESTEMIAGFIAWYYEKDGLRPIIVGHSQGGFQVLKILRKLAGLSAQRLSVWNPLTWKPEERFEIMDPLTGHSRPVVGLQLPYATSVSAGGLARFLPNQWSITAGLRKVPDSVEEFTGFFKGMDLLGGDYFGYGSANHYRPIGEARVCNIRLPSWYKHGSVPDTQHLLKSQAIRDWINHYTPSDQPVATACLDAEFDSDSTNILWAANVWFSIKKHWVLELQRAIRAKRDRAKIAADS